MFRALFSILAFLVLLSILVGFLIFVIEVYEDSSYGVSRIVKKRSKKGTYPAHLRDMWRFSFWGKDAEQIVSMNEIWGDMEDCIRKLTEGNEDAFRHALWAFEEKEFVEALSKYKVIRKNSTLLEAFANNESDPTLDSHSYDLQQRQVIVPLRRGILNFRKRYEQFERLEEKSKSNELNLLLQQDFSKIHDMKPLKEPADKLDIDTL